MCWNKSVTVSPCWYFVWNFGFPFCAVSIHTAIYLSISRSISLCLPIDFSLPLLARSLAVLHPCSSLLFLVHRHVYRGLVSGCFFVFRFVFVLFFNLPLHCVGSHKHLSGLEVTELTWLGFPSTVPGGLRRSPLIAK